VNVYDQDSGLPAGWVGCQVVPPSSEIATPTMPPASPFAAPPWTVSGVPVPTSAPAVGDETHDEGWSSGDAAAPRAPTMTSAGIIASMVTTVTSLRPPPRTGIAKGDDNTGTSIPRPTARSR
jgi:hypothetical protein